MKKLIFILSLFLIFSCSENDTSLPVDNVPGLWTWQSTKGGIANNINDTPASTGKTETLELRSDNTYTYKTDGIITSSGTFTIIDKKSIYSGENKKWIDFSNNEDRVIFYSTEHVLQLADNNTDGLVYTYSK